ncbi:MAG: hypothetical protein MUF72_03310 [Elainella sp. Prado103]|nr:hypothetical protein [Elainella sp. Prado103]
MQLSLYTQYYLRKLLRRSISHLNYPATGIGVDGCFQVNADQVLKRLYRNGFEFRAKLRELETLVQLHQAHQQSGLIQITSKIDPAASLLEIEQQIFNLLGLKFLTFISTLPLTIVSETTASLFHFVRDEQVHQGIRYADELYGLVQEFGAEQDFATHHLLLKLVDQRTPFILTASELRHGIWVSLRSPAYHLLSQQVGSQLEQIA